MRALDRTSAIRGTFGVRLFRRKKKLNPTRVWLDREMADFARRLPAGAMVLDAGAGEQPYRHHFVHCKYEAADFEAVAKKYATSTYVCDLSAIPVEAGRYDAVVFSQVMEHLPDPLAVLTELHRVLKPGGMLFYSGPLWFEEHEKPYDFYRYTSFALRHMFERSAFQIEDMRWLEGYLATATKQLKGMIKMLPWSPRAYGGGIAAVPIILLTVVFRPIAYVLARSLAYADGQSRYTKKGYPINYLAIVRRPA
jgi:SAM-dependent methyltransferase